MKDFLVTERTLKVERRETHGSNRRRWLEEIEMGKRASECLWWENAKYLRSDTRLRIMRENYFSRGVV